MDISIFMVKSENGANSEFQKSKKNCPLVLAILQQPSDS